ncbi:snare-like protein [Metschnikowia bicuspidata]|uniref:Snare-like protein n=1 Tax=Metschnikowia bicuspidata TaxID=27322 RepID=A0A4P9ZAW0_9ASCO|nr:snare-like protein [Metschnikowia bicuspidata]
MADILFVALISRDTRPLYMQMFDKGQKNESLDGDQPRSAEQTSGEATKEALSHKENREAGSFLKYNFLAHMALEVFAAPLALAAREVLADGVVLLFVQDDVAVYGMETNNGLKIVVGMSDEIERTTLLRVFGRIHRSYTRTVCNPFSEVLGAQDCENMLQTEKFDEKIRAAIRDV